jgi:HTH-type transcriptional regulator/antitoxin HigA
MTEYRFEPDYAVSPGDTLKETLDALGLSQVDLSLRTGLAEKTISQIVNGIAPISYETAAKLELVTGVPSSFWNRRELSYREALSGRAERDRLAADVALPEDERSDTDA